MHLIRFATPTGQYVGLLEDEEVRPLPAVASLADLLALPLASIRDRIAEAGAPLPAAAVRLLPPADGLMEVWAAGVTYARSRAARVLESEHEADVYDRVYPAARPELFFKAVSWRVVGDGDRISVRADSEVNVPEPELAVVYNAHAEPVGYTVCDDVSSRSIEGENPLYLPQAKVYAGSCAIGPGIRPSWEIEDPYRLTITMHVTRAGEEVWQGESSTASLHRTLDELSEYLFRELDFPDGVVLSTGTSLVPDLPFTLQTADEVTIDIDDIGTLTNTVVQGKAALGLG